MMRNRTPRAVVRAPLARSRPGEGALGRPAGAGPAPRRRRARRAALDATIKDVAREVNEAQATLDEKNRAMASYDELFASGATTVTGLLRMSGKADLAAKVKPSTRRPGQTASDAGDPAAGAGDK